MRPIWLINHVNNVTLYKIIMVITSKTYRLPCAEEISIKNINFLFLNQVLRIKLIAPVQNLVTKRLSFLLEFDWWHRHSYHDYAWSVNVVDINNSIIRLSAKIITFWQETIFIFDLDYRAWRNTGCLTRIRRLVCRIRCGLSWCCSCSGSGGNTCVRWQRPPSASLRIRAGDVTSTSLIVMTATKLTWGECMTSRGVNIRYNKFYIFYFLTLKMLKYLCINHGDQNIFFNLR